MKVIQVQHNTDEFDALTRGFVFAERINDAYAGIETKRYKEYLALVQAQLAGEPVTDPADAYRERELVPRALDAYARKHERELVTDRIYFMDEFQIAAVPDAVDRDIGITVHIRKTEDSYVDAVTKGVTREMERKSQAMMAVCEFRFWLHLDYLELPDKGIRKLFEHAVELNRFHAEEMLNALIRFLAKTRFRAEAA